MHSLKTIHDARRTRSIPQSRLHGAAPALLLRSPSGSPVFTGSPGTHRASPGAHAAPLRAQGRQQRQLASGYWAERATGAREQPKQPGIAKDEGAKAGSSPGEAVLPATTKGDGVVAGQPREEPIAPTSALQETANTEEQRRKPLRTDSSDYELVRHVGAVAPLEENAADLDTPHIEEDDWELLALDEEDAVKLGYRTALDDEKSWGSVVISPVGA
ncbi:hypothetical protein JCM6882_002315 [Rhodosporidiobolus microsporus]